MSENPGLSCSFIINFMKNTFTIRGLIFALFPKYEKNRPDSEEMEAHTLERLEKLERERPEIILMPEPENLCDSTAVRAWCEGSPIGYVAHEQTAQAGLLFDDEHLLVSARFAGINTEKKGEFFVTAELSEANLAKQFAPTAPSTAWKEWRCTVPALPMPDAWKDCRVLEFQLERLFPKPEPDDLPLLKTYLKMWTDKSLHDFSVDAMQTRKRYIDLLRSLHTPGLEIHAKRLDKQFTGICSGHRMTYRMQWWKEIQQSDSMNRYWDKWRSTRKEDNLWRDLYEVDLQLRRMPDDLYARIGDLACLFSAMRYRDDVSRRVLWDVYTLLLLRERLCRELGIRMQPLPMQGYRIDSYEEDEAPLPALTDARLARAVEQCQPYFWAKSAWAVVFCVCRDWFGVADNVSAFEKRILGLQLNRNVKEYTTGTIHSSLSNNAFMKKPISKWEESRALVLARELKAAMEVR